MEWRLKEGNSSSLVVVVRDWRGGGRGREEERNEMFSPMKRASAIKQFEMKRSGSLAIDFAARAGLHRHFCCYLWLKVGSWIHGIVHFDNYDL